MPASTIPPIGPSSEDLLKSKKLSFFGLSVNSKGNLIINEPKIFLMRFGLNGLTEEDLAESKTVGFKDLPALKTFIDKNVSAGSTTYDSDTYDALFDDGSTLQEEISAAQEDRADKKVQRDILGLPEKTEDQEPGFKNKDGRLVAPPAPAPAPAPGQAQTARPTLDQPDTGKSAFARAAANAEPDFVNRANGNARWANPVKAQLEQEAKRRLQNEIAELKKSEKATQRAGEVDEILNAKNDQYRQLYANTPDAEGNARSAEDWDAMSRDQKIKLIQNYNINKSLEKPEDDKEKKSLEKPAGEITGQKMNAQVAPRGSMEDFTTPREFNNVTNEFEVPQEPRQFDSNKGTFRTPEEIAASRVPKLEPESFEPQVRTPESPSIDMDSILSQVDEDTNEAMRTRRRQKPEIPADAVHTRHPNVPKDSHTGIYATNPAVQRRAFDTQLEHDIRNTTPHEDNIVDTRSTKVTPPPGVTLKPQEEGFLSKLKNFDLFDYVEDLQSRNNKPISPDELAKKRQAPPSMMDKLEPSRSKMLKKFDDKMGPIYEGDPAALNNTPQDYSQYFDNPAVPDAGNIYKPQAPAQSPKLPPVDPFKEDGPAEIPEPRGTVKVRNSDGSFTYTTREEQKRRAEEYAKRQMRNSPRSLLGDTHSEDMRKLYPSLNMDKLTRDVDTTNYNQQRKQFDEKYASRMYPQTAANPTPRTDTMMRNINAMPQRQQLDVINSFRKHRGEDEIHNPFS